MDFDSPDVEKDFPGLYGSERRGSEGSDFTDDGHDKFLRKDILIGKKGKDKDKKGKDKGYATLAAVSTDDEDVDQK
ncbi:unnamed protein product [Notodromas monacha]|uniref:Uncharacterized protein n=1 Tax=Notodromas monacha TaxID=399045 RepID=A0A7R9BUW1_9CRUS|nr:unnamed protein product [Notodromas monacha]CAG0922180.1 unnamed protein product [Notodromas monacha]